MFQAYSVKEVAIEMVLWFTAMVAVTFILFSIKSRKTKGNCVTEIVLLLNMIYNVHGTLSTTYAVPHVSK